MEPLHVQHLYRRAGFGIMPETLKRLSKKSRKEVVDELLNGSKTITPLTVDTSELKAVFNGQARMSRPDKETRQKLQKISRQKQIDLNVAWIDRLIAPNELLREKMVLFWANHFVCEDNNVVYIQNFNNTLRKHALGNFGDFVKAVSKEAAMTKYLNTKQNKKQKPNENFARELMELFTLGVGNYSEKDIKESARAFTGYGHDFSGRFVFKTRQHDSGVKSFLGQTGPFFGDDIIDIILQQKQCAKFICRKVYAYFVNDVVNESHVAEMAEVFYGNYDIGNLMRYIFMSDWFYDQSNIGTKIKSPIEFLVGLSALVPIEFGNPKQLLYLQKLLGQILLRPPNVAGWKGGKNWIDSNTIMLRLRLPSLLLNGAYISKIPKGEQDEFIERKKEMFRKTFKRIKAKSDWAYFNRQFKAVEIQELETYVLACKPNPVAQQYLKGLEKVSKQEYCIQLMSLPEYQMC